MDMKKAVTGSSLCESANADHFLVFHFFGTIEREELAYMFVITRFSSYHVRVNVCLSQNK